ncbi:hypothetical protein [uncultured Methylobacterium sp.]|jgi:hypothetical protein|uniref:hypothetical protein n=1 Tax=uncultured Methylobacterium sp. TaxID=157278 RepID=UPI002608E972|nr:hypothetical protein [uncultured Methylobacterium sp.]
MRALKSVLVLVALGYIAISLYYLSTNPGFADAWSQAQLFGLDLRDRTWSYLGSLDPGRFSVGSQEVVLLAVLAAFVLVSLLTVASSRRTGRLVARHVEANNRLLSVLIAEAATQKQAEAQRVRAYLGIAGITFQQFAPGKRIAVQVEIRNYGATPARAFVPDLQILVRTFPDLSTEDGRAEPAEIFPGTLAAGQGRSLVYALDLSAHPNIAERIVSGELALYLRGRVQYEDVFGNPQQLTVNAVTRGQRVNEREPFTLLETGNEAT